MEAFISHRANHHRNDPPPNFSASRLDMECLVNLSLIVSLTFRSMPCVELEGFDPAMNARLSKEEPAPFVRQEC
jgi:hypothetical protein